MATNPIRKKKISSDDTVFFVFKLNNGQYALYDSGMGDPIQYGQQNLITGEISEQIKLAKKGKRKKFKVFWMQQHANNGWEEILENDPKYSMGRKSGILNEMPTPDKNTVNAQLSKMRGFPENSANNCKLYWFFLGTEGKGLQFLYDEDMGSPLWGNNRQKIVPFLQQLDEDVRNNKRKEYVLWCLDRLDANQIWKKCSLKWIPKFKVDASEKRKIVEEKK